MAILQNGSVECPCTLIHTDLTIRLRENSGKARSLDSSVSTVSKEFDNVTLSGSLMVLASVWANQFLR